MATVFNDFPETPEITAKPPRKAVKKHHRKRKMLKTLKQQRNILMQIAETLKRIEAEQVRKVEEAQKAAEECKKTPGFFEKIENAIVKAVPMILSAVAGLFFKAWLNRSLPATVL